MGRSERNLDLDALVHRVADGDTAAFASLYDLTCDRVFGMVLKVLRDRGYSEETTHDVYVEVWRTAGRFDPAAGSAVSWLLTLAHRRAVDRVRSEVSARRREIAYGAERERESDVVVDTVLAHDERGQVVRCLGVLSGLQRQAIELAYYDGLTYRQVSDRLSTSLGTVKTRMRDGLRKLSDCLGGL